MFNYGCLNTYKHNGMNSIKLRVIHFTELLKIQCDIILLDNHFASPFDFPQP